MSRKSLLRWIILLPIFLASCAVPTELPTATIAPALPSATLAATGTPAAPATPAPTQVPPTPTTSPTRTPIPPTSTITAVPAPELLGCPAVDAPQPTQPVRLLYANDNRLWTWDEASGGRAQYPLPTGAVAPLISPDGRLAAFLMDGVAFDTPQRRVERIPLRIFDTQTYAVRDAATFSTTEVRRLYPASPRITLQMEWLPGHILLVQIYPEPSGTGILQPTGPLYLVDVESGTSRQILPAGGYELYGIRPDGKQIAALDSAANQTDGTTNFDNVQQGSLILIDVASGAITFETRVILPADSWGISSLAYSPDGTKIAYNAASGIEILDVARQTVMIAPLTNTCLAENNCYWTDRLPVYWLPDSQSFYTMQATNDFFDARAETVLSRVYTGLNGWIEPLGTVRANPATISFTPNRRTLTYWNHPDFDTLNQGQGDMNWDELHLMDLQEGQPKWYTAEYVLRVIQWHPDSRRFLYISSPYGGANPVTTRLTLGDLCQPPVELPVPGGLIVNRAVWLRGDRFLAWTLPAAGIPERYVSRLYLYDLGNGGAPTYIADLFQQPNLPYGAQEQVVVISE